jgi:release factor glutamine methyltransferase
VARLRAAGCVFAEEEAALLVAAATGPALESLVARRVAGVPLEHLLGWASFAGLRVVVAPGVFVPRRRSELLVDLALEIVSDEVVVDPAVRQPFRHSLSDAGRVLDLCCGSGAIGAAVAARIPDAEVWAADVDPAAVACARRNLPPERVCEGDLYAALPAGLRGGFDVVVVNAPYVPSDAIALMPSEAREHEPRAALDGGADGVDLHRRVAAGAGDWLRPGGSLVVETSRRQAPLTLEACGAAGLTARVVVDDEREATAVVAVSRR